MQKNFFEILVLTALTVGLIWTILELTPKSALLSLTILYSEPQLKTTVRGAFCLRFGRFLPLPKNIPKNCLKLSYPVQGNDKILVRFNRLVVKNITVQK